MHFVHLDVNNMIPTPSVSWENNCHTGFTSYWYACYRLLTDKRDQSGAANECRALGGELVSVHDPAENSAVFSLAQGQFPLLIGLLKVTIYDIH